MTLVAADRGGWRAAGALLHGLAAAALATWFGDQVWLALAGLPVARLAWRLDRPATPALTWDGAAWRVDDQAAALRSRLDLGPWMLLRWTRESGAGGWCAVSAAAAGAAWGPLRRALFAPAASGASPVGAA